MFITGPQIGERVACSHGGAGLASKQSCAATISIGPGVEGTAARCRSACTDQPLQEAGYLPIVAWPDLPRRDLPGIYPTRETLLAQLTIAALLALGFACNKRSTRRASLPVAAR